MNQESVVYGCIKDVKSHLQDPVRQDTNRTAMLRLPKAEDWSFLSQEMFALPQPNSDAIIESGDDASSKSSRAACYSTEVIHFGASYQAIEYEWKGWLAAFEALLKDMYWVSAIVHLETELSGLHTFTWEAVGLEHSPGLKVEAGSRQWTHELF